MAKTVNILKAGLRRTFLAAGHDLTAEQWGVFLFVCREPGLTQSDLAERTFKDKPTITRILDRLEKKNLLGRRPNVLDRRSFTIYPTRVGLELYPELAEAARSYSSLVLGGLRPGEVDTLLDLISRIASRGRAAAKTRGGGALTG
ncbi:MAG: MarR family transcriptional regulator [Desulfovibrionaceae bacterium]|nr:MarR family transcriptional regulator [Desulfovibrionaceae bacterium]MBF0512927.1 MarR family transcriptional regulator [Desulfovibrionaceae bacterium]